MNANSYEQALAANAALWAAVDTLRGHIEAEGVTLAAYVQSLETQAPDRETDIAWEAFVAARLGRCIQMEKIATGPLSRQLDAAENTAIRKAVATTTRQAVAA